MLIAAFSLATLTLTSPAQELTREHELPHLGLRILERRSVDPRSGRVLRWCLDSRGRAIDLDLALRDERNAALAARGKLSRDLAERVEAARIAGARDVDVVFWLEEPEHEDWLVQIERLVHDGLDVHAARALVLERARATFAPGNSAFAERLVAAGCEVTLVGDFWPDVFARVPLERLRELAADPVVQVAYHAFSSGGPEQQFAQGTMRTFNVHDAGISGATGPTKVLVNDCGEVTTTHTWLPPVIQMTANGVQSHPCGVAGNIAMNGGAYAAAAKGLAQLYSADGCGSDAPAQAAWSWGLQQGIDVGNCSWWNGNKGSIVFLDRFFDYTVRNYSVMLFKSNGNQGTTNPPTSTSPGNGYNMISVGCYNDANDVAWSNDAMASYSSYGNPIEGHEKPEVSTPGDACTSTGTSGTSTQNFNGTSSASPLACGVGVTVLNTAPALLASMTTLKAALMVSAWHNIEGAAVLSDRDGAGGIDALAAHAVVRDGRFETGTFQAASFPSGTYDRSVDLAAGEETRIVALWFSDPDAAYAVDTLKMDLDLSVLDPSGAVVASSLSTTNPFEIVQFTPTLSGAHTVRLTRQRFLGTSEPYTIAWSTRRDGATASVTFQGTPSLGAALTTNFWSRYEASVAYRAVVSLYGAPYSLPIGPGRVLPLGPDRLALYSLAGNLPWLLSNYSGNLDATGRASGTLQIPSDPRWLGVTLRVAMFTHAAGAPSSVRETSPAATFTVQ